MAVLTLTSTNPDFSYIIAKNPNTQKEAGKPFQSRVRKGILYGWFTNEEATSFRMWFKDHPSELSYSNKEFEYLDRTRYNHPFILINALDALLRTAYTTSSEKDVGAHTHQFICDCDIFNRVMFNRFLKCDILGFTLTVNEVGQLIFTSTVSVNHLLNIVMLFAGIQAAFDEDIFVELRTEALQKYVRVLNQIDAPFWLRHIFVKSMIKSPERLNTIISDLAEPGQIFRWGNTQEQRFQFIQNQFREYPDSGEVIVYDIGCGELSHTLRLQKKHDKKIGRIYAFDKDAEIVEIGQSKVAARKLEDKIVVLQESSKFGELVEENSVILLVEVLEHMPLGEAKDLLAEVLTAKPHKVIVTMPDSDFNKFYGMEEGTMRHPDHHYELTLKEFQAHFCSDVPGYQTLIHYGHMDECHGITSNICVTFTKESN